MAKKKAAPKSSSAMNYPGGPSSAEQRRWQAEDDLRALRRAEEIRADRGRLARAQRMAATEIKALNRVKGKR